MREVKQYDRTMLLSLLKQMLLIRRFEEKASQMYGLRKIGGFCHLYIGQEASAVGAIATLDLKKDYVVSAYRDHGLAIASGMESSVLMAELYGKVTGCSRGKGGSMHFFDKEKHFLGGNGIVGAHIPTATGVALAIRYREQDGVVLCFFGDGAIHQGSFHESVNMAKIWNLPVLYICENNQYGMGTDYRRVSAVTDFSVMGTSYGIEGKQVNGMDVLEVYDAVGEMVQKARKEHAPSLLELKTYRYKGHSMSDPARYRTREELDAFREQDPILLLKARMIRDQRLTEEEFLGMDAEVKKECEEAVEFARESEEPPLESIYQDVLA
ncbi:pyruvate dehydrogenase (acetyl-transferring) E1 component subunit alpha [Cellulosispirillum alkaliphilum]|uniref:pyruvate dehydrogenase (acetyl-transferring) E1 component subunit alpha n=1 Tax=Cellulosispirillum alkaliphilum TaxID=3039283 RepID=UPI003D6EA472